MVFVDVVGKVRDSSVEYGNVKVGCEIGWDFWQAGEVLLFNATYGYQSG